jgi:hypothetical protein
MTVANEAKAMGWLLAVGGLFVAFRGSKKSCSRVILHAHQALLSRARYISGPYDVRTYKLLRGPVNVTRQSITHLLALALFILTLPKSHMTGCCSAGLAACTNFM